MPIPQLPDDPAVWEFDILHGPGTTVKATCQAYGDTFGFEVCSTDPSCEVAARDAGYPTRVIRVALELLRLAT